jgi:hypothetical protein
MAHLLLELHTRLEAIGHTRGEEFGLPVTQNDLSDCLGLSVVHTNRVIQHFRNEGLVTVDLPTKLEKLRQDAIDCQLISDFATTPDKRALFARAALNLHTLANEVQKLIIAREAAQRKAARPTLRGNPVAVH